MLSISYQFSFPASHAKDVAVVVKAAFAKKYPSVALRKIKCLPVAVILFQSLLANYSFMYLHALINRKWCLPDPTALH
jgi:hypothetical protein